MPEPLRICLSAGEPSGDRYAAELLLALRAQVPQLAADAVGGPRLAAAGARLIAPADSLSSMGFVEPLARMRTHLAVLGRLRRLLAEGHYRLVILVDYPGFNLRLARAATQHGVPTLYYVAPQVWAWGAGRIRQIRRWVRALAVILPFEEAFFRAHGLRAEFVGHPLLDTSYPNRAAARAALGLGREERAVALLPGSRPQEVRRLWPALRDAVGLLRRDDPGLVALVAAVPGCRYPEPGAVQLCWDRSATVLAAADLVLCKAGTGALEAAVLDVPSVVAYRTDALSYALARRLARVRFASLVNLIADEPLVPELIQQDATAGRIAQAARPLLNPESAAADRQRTGYARVRQALGQAGAAQRVAALALELAA